MYSYAEKSASSLTFCCLAHKQPQDLCEKDAEFGRLELSPKVKSKEQ